MTSHETPIYRHVIAALVTNEPGVLAQVAGMFAARGFNIDSLVVGRTENADISRMTIVVNGSDAILEQVRKQLSKLVPVVKVVDYKEVPFVERDLMLITVSSVGDGTKSTRSEIVELANLFRAKVVDVASNQVTIELAGPEEKIEAFMELMKPYGITEVARTGVIAMPRGLLGSGQRAQLTSNRAGGKDITPSGPSIDPSSLPPG